jgi:outer membrane lipopolysaccharide assembly protein LptE/RlpB
MKKVLCAVLVVVMMLSMVACGKTLKGTYEAEIDLALLKYTATYEFSGSKVEITKKTTILGNVNTVSFEGKYEIAENDDGSMEITIALESEDDEIKSGTYTFEEGEDYIKIAGVQYNKKG